jgi:hypothetical protein
MSARKGAIGSLAAAVVAAACGRIETEVGAELPRDAGAPETSVFDAGVHSADARVDSSDAGSCPPGDLSNIGMADFHVSLTVTTTESGTVALANQRSQCGPSVFWDIRILDGGYLYAETDDIMAYATALSPGPRVNDGRPHDVLVQRKARVLSVIVDDGGSSTFPSWASFGKLPPLAVGTDVCIPQDGTMPLKGTVTKLCVTSP